MVPPCRNRPKVYLSAISGLDKAVSTWNFDLLMNEKRNASIDSIEAVAEVAPNQDVRANAVVRNVGNTPNNLNITLLGLDAEGNPLPNRVPLTDSTSGWVVALFGGLEDVVLQPNESRTIEIGFQAPNEFQGEMNVELQVFASGAKANTLKVKTKAIINRTSSADLTYVASGCQAIILNQTCDVVLSVRNTGNSYNTFLLRNGGTTDGFSLGLPASHSCSSQTKSKHSLQRHSKHLAKPWPLRSEHRRLKSWTTPAKALTKLRSP